MNGIALTVLISQLPKLFGFSIDALAAILLLNPTKRIPGLLLAVFAATIAVGILNLDATASAKVLGPLPQGLPSFTLPMINFGQLDEVIIGGYVVAMMAFADTSVLSRTYAVKTLMPVDPNQEMIGLGAANLAAGLVTRKPWKIRDVEARGVEPLFL
jgi:MFS superfamily sulfate permease-like transporter